MSSPPPPRRKPPPFQKWPPSLFKQYFSAPKNLLTPLKRGKGGGGGNYVRGESLVNHISENIVKKDSEFSSNISGFSGSYFSWVFSQFLSQIFGIIQCPHTTNNIYIPNTIHVIMYRSLQFFNFLNSISISLFQQIV